MSIEAMKQGLEALELLRSGLIQMRRHSEEYGRAWAGAYVEEYQKLLSGSAVEQFRILNALQDRLADVDEAVVDGYQAIASLRLAIAEAERQSASTNGAAGTEKCAPGGGGYPVASGRLIEMRGAFADGWINAESAHGIKEKA